MTFEAVDDMTAKISVETPLSPTLFLPKVANYNGGFIVCSQAVEALGLEALATQPVGTGPFTFESYTPQTSVVLTANDAYYRDAPQLAGVEVRYMPDAARATGVKNGRTLRVHLLPNVLGELLVFGSLWAASAIRLEASLSFIGLGEQPPTPTQGQMIREGMLYLTMVPWYSLGPGLALLLTVFAFNLVGDGLRDALDPRSRS